MDGKVVLTLNIVLLPRARVAVKVWQLTGLTLRRATANPTTATE
jgi:hypothetical protein